MLCDELKSLKNIGLSFDTTTLHKQVIAEDSEGKCYGFDSWEEIYLKSEVDEAIAELKKKLEDAKMRADLAECAVTEYKIDYDKLKSEADKVLAEKDRLIAELKSKAPQWVRLSYRLPTTAGPHLVIFQNGRGGCLPFNVEAKSFQVAGTVQWWADGTDIFGDWTGDK